MGQRQDEVTGHDHLAIGHVHLDAITMGRQSSQLGVEAKFAPCLDHTPTLFNC
jgi:hypothetical protein